VVAVSSHAFLISCSVLFYSQGLTYAHKQLYESTGLWGQSTVRILDPATADVIKTIPMDSSLFGEGMTFYKGKKLVQITWKSKRGFIYNATNLELIDEFAYTTTRNEGWGITWDRCQNEFIVTDGSPYLHIWDPDTMAEKRKVLVTRMNGEPAKELNEIEFWRGRLLANVWYEDVLLVIHPVTGKVEKEYGTYWLLTMLEASISCVFESVCSYACFTTTMKTSRRFGPNPSAKALEQMSLTEYLYQMRLMFCT
jgi:glutamine cyclotransferase